MSPFWRCQLKISALGGDEQLDKSTAGMHNIDSYKMPES